MNSNQKPFFIFNPKSYLLKKELFELAQIADKLAKKYEDEIDVYVTSPYVYLSELCQKFDNIKVSAQHMDGINLGRGMGFAVSDSYKEIGVKATFLNHAEHQLTLSELVSSITRAKENGIESVVCADSFEEAKAIAMLDPDIILCEPTELIGTGTVSDEDYIERTNNVIREVNDNIRVMQAAGISTADDVYRTISLGADGTGCTSGIVKAENPKQMIEDMIEALVKAINDRKK